MKLLGALLFGVAGACGGTQAPATQHADTNAAATSTPEPCWPVAPMRVVTPHAGGWEPVAEMTGDGSMYALKDGRRRFIGRVSNDAVLDAHDTPSMTCIHKQIDVVGAAFKGKYDDQDAYVDSRTRIAVGDDGAITLALGDHPPQTSARVEGVTPRTRRTAVLFVLSLFAGGISDW